MFHNWLVFWTCLQIASSLSSMNAITLPSCTWVAQRAGGHHVTWYKWPTGVEPPRLTPTSAHAGLQIRVQTAAAVAIAIKRMIHGVKTAVFLQKSPTSLFCNWNSGIQRDPAKKVTTRWENWSVTEWLEAWLETLRYQLYYCNVNTTSC